MKPLPLLFLLLVAGCATKPVALVPNAQPALASKSRSVALLVAPQPQMSALMPIAYPKDVVTRSWDLQSSRDLTTWTTEQAQPLGLPGWTLIVTNDGHEPHKFYRMMGTKL